jgi:hypothetical protein
MTIESPEGFSDSVPKGKNNEHLWDIILFRIMAEKSAAQHKEEETTQLLSEARRTVFEIFTMVDNMVARDNFPVDMSQVHIEETVVYSDGHIVVKLHPQLFRQSERAIQIMFEYALKACRQLGVEGNYNLLPPRLYLYNRKLQIR